MTDTAILAILGKRVERHRIEAGLTQAELAERAGIGKRTLERLEAGRGTELVTLLRVLRILNSLEGLERLLPEHYEPHNAFVLDVVMLLWTHGRERKLSEFEAMFEETGFRLDRVSQNPEGMSVFEAVPA